MPVSIKEYKDDPHGLRYSLQVSDDADPGYKSETGDPFLADFRLVPMSGISFDDIEKYATT